MTGGKIVEHYTQILKQFGVAMTVAGFIIGIIMAFIVFFAFMSKKHENRFHGFLGWLYNYLNFKNFIIEGLLKFCYVLGACICTMVGVFNILCLQLVTGFGVLIFGNLVLRIIYEFALMIVLICRNVTEINRKMGGSVADNIIFKECEMPPMPKKEDFVMRPPQSSSVAAQTTAAQTVAPQSAAPQTTQELNSMQETAATVEYSDFLAENEGAKEDGSPAEPKPEGGVCPDCRKNVSKEDSFCKNCGKRLIEC